MPIIYLKAKILEEAEGVSTGWNNGANVAAVSKIDDVYPSLDSDECHAFWADETGPNSARLRVTVETMPPVHSIDSVTLVAATRRSGGGYTGADFRPFLWIGGTAYYRTPSEWLSPTDFAALDNGDGWVRAPFGASAAASLLVLPKWLRNPVDDSEWDRDVINSAGIAGFYARNLDTELSTGPFLGILGLLVEYSGAPAYQEQSRDAGSRSLWGRSRTRRRLNGQAVPREIGRQVRPMGVHKLRHFAGPHEDGLGWRGRPWQERHFQVREIEMRDDGTRIISGPERHELRCVFYDSMILPTNVSQATEDGALRFGKGGAGTYTRDDDAWSLDPGSKLFTTVAPNTKPFSADGFESYGAYSNDVPQSAFQDLSAWALTGGGVNGSSFALESGATGELLGETMGWEPVTTGVTQSLLAIAGAPHTTTLKRTSNATPEYPADTKVGLTIPWTQYIAGQPGYAALQRQVDGYYYNFATHTWQSAAYWQDLTDDLGLVGTIRGTTGDLQFWCASAIDVGPDATTLTATVALPTGLDVVDNQATRFYGVMISPGLLVGPPMILTAAAPVTRSAGLLRWENNVGKRRVWMPQGALSCRVVARWQGTEQDEEIKRVVWFVYYDDDNQMALYYNNGVNDFTGWSFQYISGGVIYGSLIDTSLIGIPAGVPLYLTAYWTGSHGELGVTPYTISLYLRGMNAVGAARIIKGNDVVVTPLTETDVSYLEIGSRLNVNHFNGEISRIRSQQWVPTYAEAARLP
jgi:hypothetical protein